MERFGFPIERGAESSTFGRVKSVPPALMTIRFYRASDEAAVIELWRACALVRWADPRKEIARKLRVDPKGILVGEIAGVVMSTCMIGYDGHRGWINLLAVAPAWQHGGHGRAIMAEAERILRAAGCPKINLQVRATNRKVIAFYKKLGFEAENLFHLGKRLERD